MNVNSPLTRSHEDRILTGWGRTAPSRSRVTSPTNTQAIVDAVRDASSRGVLARGLGRSYGDAAQSGGGHVLDMTEMRTFELDVLKGTVTVDAGVSVDGLLRSIVPAGFFIPVTAGTRYVTIGGAVAADIHGKNHHRDGSFAQHVDSLRLVDGSGTIRELSPHDPSSADEFWATAGGMGLTGVITQATIRLLPIETSKILVQTRRFASLDEVMSQMVDGDHHHRYSVAWLDTVSPSGRGVLTWGDHAPVDVLPMPMPEDPLAYAPQQRLGAPAVFPSGALNSATVRAFNEAWFRKHPERRDDELVSIASFFHPLDGVRDWNRIYGPRGFVQYQFAVPDSAGWLVEHTLRQLRAAGAPSFLTVLKRFGAGNPGPLSFPIPGWTLAVDVAAGNDRLASTLDRLDELVAENGGRLYLAKDSRQSPEMVVRTYPRLVEWHGLRDQMDPRRVFTSDLGRRLLL